MSNQLHDWSLKRWRSWRGLERGDGIVFYIMPITTLTPWIICLFLAFPSNAMIWRASGGRCGTTAPASAPTDILSAPCESFRRLKDDSSLRSVISVDRGLIAAHVWKVRGHTVNTAHYEMGERVNNGLFSVLPDEVCLRILYYLPCSDVCKCMRVCRRWYMLCNDASLWTNVEISCRSIQYTCIYMSNMTYVPMYMYTCSYVYIGCVWFVGRCLVINDFDCFYRFVNTVFLEKLVSSRPRLRSVMFLSNATDRLSGWQNLSDSWLKLKRIESITFVSCPSVVLDSLTNIITCCPQLKCVRCECSPSFTSEHFLSLMSPDHSYTELSLAHCNRTDDATIYFAFQAFDVSRRLSSLQVMESWGILVIMSYIIEY